MRVGVRLVGGREVREGVREEEKDKCAVVG